MASCSTSSRRHSDLGQITLWAGHPGSWAPRGAIDRWTDKDGAVRTIPQRPSAVRCGAALLLLLLPRLASLAALRPTALGRAGPGPARTSRPSKWPSGHPARITQIHKAVRCALWRRGAMEPKTTPHLNRIEHPSNAERRAEPSRAEPSRAEPSRAESRVGRWHCGGSQARSRRGEAGRSVGGAETGSSWNADGQYILHVLSGII